MNHLKKLSWLFAFIFFLGITTVSAQTKDDLFIGSVDITWLGLDFSQTKFIGSATQFKDAGEVTNSEFKDKYASGWNNLFVNEQKKYNVAKVVHRTEEQVKYALEVTQKTNNALKKDFFSMNPSDYMLLDEAKVEDLVKKYNYQGKTGIGLIMFIEGMSKGKDEASAWVVYVDMKAKKVILSKHITGKAGGFGFKNYWAKAFYNILKDSDYKDWK